MSLTVLMPDVGESWDAFARRVQKASGQLLVVLPTAVHIESIKTDKEFHAFLDVCKQLTDRLMIAAQKRVFIVTARQKGIRVLESSREIKDLLGDDPILAEVLRILSPHIWRQQLRSRLQSMGLLSLPKLRIWVLITVSSILLFFVIFRLLPSAEVVVWPRGDTITQTANIFLVQSGVLTTDIPPRVRTLELIPLTVRVDRTISFDQISKDFYGINAQVPMTVINESEEEYSLRAGTRLTNQAGMIFRLQEPVIIQPGREITVKAIADDLDLYGEILGDRGNVPADLEWVFPGLAREEQQKIYAVNRVPASGGTTEYRTVLAQKDLDIAKKQLEQELLVVANQMLEEEREVINASSNSRMVDRLFYEEFTIATYSGFILPTQFVGEKVQSVPVSGSIEYTAFAYDKQAALNMLTKEIVEHVGEGRRLIDDSINLDMLVHHVIDYTDDLGWIKLTVDLTGRERYILDPLSPAGAKFAMTLRNRITELPKDEALSVVKNMPEVEEAEIKLWPPWSSTMPSIPSHITITPVSE